MASKWNWREQRERKAFLALQDGTILRGYSVGAPVDGFGEVVFNTGMAGYQEILSDPSYSGQFVTMTYPEIGNTGMNLPDMESRQLFANGFVIHNMNETSNWRADGSLKDYLVKWNIPAIAGIDTRALTTRLRTEGTQRGFMSVTGTVSEADAVKKALEWGGLDGQDYAAKVSCKAPYKWDVDGTLTASWGIASALPPADLKIVAYDFGIKWNILRSLRLNGMEVTVVPAQTPAAEVLKLKPDGVFLSNGPADPAAVTYAIEAARALLGKVPLMGICLGHQILGLACGGKTYRLKFGHHGCNHPVKNLRTGAVEITSQNHNFAVDPASINPALVEVTHINLNDQTVEGLSHRKEPMFCVQYHPESSPGPHDPYYLFGQFRDMIRKA
ncbi:MAG: glutamine-hydrolyzing carbamoyl-phosphate synthase small subunit [bacterium]